MVHTKITHRNINYKSTYMKLLLKKIALISIISLSIGACQNQSKKAEKPEVPKQEIDQKTYAKKGKAIAQATFKVFKKNIEAIAQTNGLPAVVNFCQHSALKITDSMSKANNVIIKRTSNKIRNMKNAPDSDQKLVIDSYLRTQEKQNNQMEPIVMTDDKGFVHFYAPIKIKKACLKCHGTPEKDISAPILKMIKEHYPNDKATGFREGELRGIWDIKFLK